MKRRNKPLVRTRKGKRTARGFLARLLPAPPVSKPETDEQHQELTPPAHAIVPLPAPEEKPREAGSSHPTEDKWPIGMGQAAPRPGIGIGVPVQMPTVIPAQPAIFPQPAERSPESSRLRRTVLYVEDNADNSLLVRRALEARGYTFMWARNGVEGLKMVDELRPDLLLLDINLPDVDGYEIARRLRSSGKQYMVYLPIIAITANALKGDAEKALAAGCDVYMSKPINLRELWARVEAYLPTAD